MTTMSISDNSRDNHISDIGIVRCLLLLSWIILLCSGPQTAIGAEASAFDVVRVNTESLTKKLVEIRSLYKEEKEAYYEQVDLTLSPLIDFDGFSRGVMAKYYRAANEHQRKNFSSKFKDGLIRTYAEAMAEFDNQKIEVLEEIPSKKKGRSTVKLAFHGKDGTIYPIEYSMVQKDEGWLLRNVTINGINVGLQFKSQFGASMQKYQNNIDDVISNWSTRVAVDNSQES